MNNRIRSFKEFMISRILENDGKIDQDEDAWEEGFDLDRKRREESGEITSQGDDIPDWAKEGLKFDALKGKNADERWSWLTDRVEKVLKSQVSKIQEVTKNSPGNLPGYRLLWKEEKTETVDQQDKEGNVYKVYFTEIYKGNPGTWVDRKNDGGKPGELLGMGYWGQNPSSAGGAGSTGGTSSNVTGGVPGGIFWLDEPKKTYAGGTAGDISLLDLVAATEMGKEFLLGVMDDPEIKKVLQQNGVDFTDSPPAVQDIDNSFTEEQKKTQEKNIEKLRSSGSTVEKPNFKLITSTSDYTYNPQSFRLGWDQVKKALESSKLDSKLDFNKWNLVGIRNTLGVKNQYQNRFTDLIVLMGPKDKKEMKIYSVTTTPGLSYIYEPFRNWYLASALKSTINLDGVAILQKGVYDYKVGEFDGDTVLVPSSRVTIGRISPVLSLSEVKFQTFEPSKKETDNFQINISKASPGEINSIDSWSAGSQVFKKGGDFKEFMSIISGRAKQSTYKYALIDSSNLEEKKK